MNDLGSRIRQERLKKGFSQNDIVARTGISQNILSRTETGKSIPDLETIKKIATALDVSVDYLLGREKPQPDRSSQEIKPFIQDFIDNQTHFPALVSKPLTDTEIIALNMLPAEYLTPYTLYTIICVLRADSGDQK